MQVRCLAFLFVASLSSCQQQGEANSSAPVLEEQSPSERLWVVTKHVDRHTCPSSKCGVVGRAFFREALNALEKRDGWVRVTKLYDASCSNGRSQYVDEGNSSCSSANGIVDGKFAEWVPDSSLSADRPPDPAKTASAAERLVAQSDDFTEHRAAFVKAANELISNGRCTEGDFEEQGGWVKSSNHRDEPVYFTYCGEMTIANRIYLNAQTGKIYQE